MGAGSFMGLLPQSARILACAMTRLQRSSSVRTRLDRRSGSPPAGDSPCLARISFTSARARMALISPLSLRTISAGVEAGAVQPYQTPGSAPGGPARPQGREGGNDGDPFAFSHARQRDLAP